MKIIGMKIEIIKLIQVILLINFTFSSEIIFGQYDFKNLKVENVKFNDFYIGDASFSKNFLYNVLIENDKKVVFKKKIKYYKTINDKKKKVAFYKFKAIFDNELPTNINYTDSIFFDINFVKFQMDKGDSKVIELFKIDTINVAYVKPFQYYEVKININNKWRRLILKLNKSNSKKVQDNFNSVGAVKMMINEILNEIYFFQNFNVAFKFDGTK